MKKLLRKHLREKQENENKFLPKLKLTSYFKSYRLWEVYFSFFFFDKNEYGEMYQNLF